MFKSFCQRPFRDHRAPKNPKVCVEMLHIYITISVAVCVPKINLSRCRIKCVAVGNSSFVLKV